MSNSTLFALILAAVLIGDRIAAPATANDTHIVPFQVERIIDGDTIAGQAFAWPNLRLAVSVRLRGVDTPELRGGCEASKAKARAAKALVDSLVSGKRVLLGQPANGKYASRVVADVWVDGVSLGQVLLRRGLAKPYDGKGKPDWCEED